MRLLSNIFKDCNVKIDDRYVLIEEIKKDDISEVINSPDHEIKTDIKIKNNKILWRTRAQAKKIIDEAQQLSKKYFEDAMQQSKLEFEQARISGYKEGFKEGKNLIQQKMQIAIDELTELIESVEKEKQNIFIKYQEELKNLSLSIAKKIIDTDLKSSDDAFLYLYKSALKYHNKQETLKLTVSDLDVEFVTSNKQILLSMASGAKSINIVAVENAPKGTLILETEQSIIDASAESQFEKIKQSLINAEVSVK
jgi:flagellar assembly protein FliH